MAVTFATVKEEGVLSSPEFFRTVDFLPVIDEGSCTLCLKCVKVCGLGVITYKKGEGLAAEKGRCRNCRSCIEVCGAAAIQISAELKSSGLGCLKER